MGVCVFLVRSAAFLDDPFDVSNTGLFGKIVRLDGFVGNLDGQGCSTEIFVCDAIGQNSSNLAGILGIEVLPELLHFGLWMRLLCLCRGWCRCWSRVRGQH